MNDKAIQRLVCLSLPTQKMVIVSFVLQKPFGENVGILELDWLELNDSLLSEMRMEELSVLAKARSIWQERNIRVPAHPNKRFKTLPL